LKAIMLSEILRGIISAGGCGQGECYYHAGHAKQIYKPKDDNATCICLRSKSMPILLRTKFV